MSGFEFKHKIYAKWFNQAPHLVATTKYRSVAICIGESVSRMTRGECLVRIYHRNNEWIERLYVNGQLDYVKLSEDQKNTSRAFWHDMMKTHETVPKQKSIDFDTTNVICKVDYDNCMKPTERKLI